jgi:hypothetical protein
MRGYYLRFKGYPAGKIQWDEQELFIKVRHQDKKEQIQIYNTIIQYFQELGFQLIPANNGIRITTSLSDIYSSKKRNQKKKKHINIRHVKLKRKNGKLTSFKKQKVK